MGATTPSEVFSAAVSTAARVTPASSSRVVSRPTIMDTAYRLFSNSHHRVGDAVGITDQQIDAEAHHKGE